MPALSYSPGRAGLAVLRILRTDLGDVAPPQERGTCGGEPETA